MMMYRYIAKIRSSSSSGSGDDDVVNDDSLVVLKSVHDWYKWW